MALFLGAVGVIALVTLVPANGVPAARMSRAWCLVCGPSWLADAVANVALFLPLGAAVSVGRMRARTALLMGAALSLAVELVQWSGIVGARSPAVADLVTNSLGAVAGWGLAQRARATRWRSAAVARRLANGWGAVVLLVLAGTSLAVQPAAPWPPATDTVTRPSGFSYSPAFGYFGGEITRVSINDQRLPHPGYGPLVREVAVLGDTLRLELQLRRLEQALTRRSIVFLHAAGDSTPTFMLAQHGSRVEVRRRIRAEAAGFTPLMLVHETGSWRPDEPVRIAAASSSRELAVTVQRHNRVSTSVWALTPLVGWALWQSVVTPGNAGARLVQACWTIALFLPFGWLVAGARVTQGATGVLAALVWPTALTLALLGLPAALDIHPVRLTDWLLVIGAFGIGALLRRDKARLWSGGRAG
jgi:hypothetical protein